MPSDSGLPCLLMRADCSAQIGTGHVTRCLALGQAWQVHDGTAAFLSRCQGDALRRCIESTGVGFIPLDKPHPDPSDLQITLLKLKELAMRGGQRPWLILDGYHFDAAYQKAVKEAGFPLMAIDDLAQQHFWADLVLNQNIYAREELYSTEPYTRLLIGPRYALLRDEFTLRRYRSRSNRERAKHILVTLGGADPDNTTLKVVNAISMLKEDIKTLVVIGPSYPHSGSLARYIDGGPSRFVLRMAVDSMAELMDWADLAVSGGGSTCWELACLGVPNLILALADNQRQNGQELARGGVSVYLGWWEDISTEAIAETLQQVIENGEARRKMNKAGRALVDGYGVNRVAAAIRELCISRR